MSGQTTQASFTAAYPPNEAQAATPNVSTNPGTCAGERTQWVPDGKTGRSAVANVGYAWVSTLDQDLSLQLDALTAAECGKFFEDRASGARANRAGSTASADRC